MIQGLIERLGGNRSVDFVRLAGHQNFLKRNAILEGVKITGEEREIRALHYRQRRVGKRKVRRLPTLRKDREVGSESFRLRAPHGALEAVVWSRDWSARRRRRWFQCC